MKRLAVIFGCLMLLATPAMATTEFNKQWKDKFVGDDSEASDEFKIAVKKAGCHVCHVKGKQKKEKDSRNEYGAAINKFLKAEDFTKEKVKADPEGTKAAILEGFNKAAELTSKDEKKFGDKIKNNELPATDAGI